jgi:S-formylglutathione hydrolase FrmB
MFNRHLAREASQNAAWHERLGFAGPSVPARACCCPAMPVVKVSMPPVPGRPYPVDLWLCGHHYRSSWAALDAAGATVDLADELWDQLLAERAATAA